MLFCLDKTKFLRINKFQIGQRHVERPSTIRERERRIQANSLWSDMSGHDVQLPATGVVSQEGFLFKNKGEFGLVWDLLSLR